MKLNISKLDKLKKVNNKDIINFKDCVKFFYLFSKKEIKFVTNSFLGFNTVYFIKSKTTSYRIDIYTEKCKIFARTYYY